MLSLSPVSSRGLKYQILSSGRKTSFFIADIGEYGNAEWEIFEDLRVRNNNPDFDPPVRPVSFTFHPTRKAALAAASHLHLDLLAA